MGVLLITSVIVVFANLLADIAYAVVDPRIKY
jgi:ABC-type dipeptide/oligopeptide/nickel transport system permease component